MSRALRSTSLGTLWSQLELELSSSCADSLGSHSFDPVQYGRKRPYGQLTPRDSHRYSLLIELRRHTMTPHQLASVLLPSIKVEDEAVL